MEGGGSLFGIEQKKHGTYSIEGAVPLHISKPGVLSTRQASSE